MFLNWHAIKLLLYSDVHFFHTSIASKLSSFSCKRIIAIEADLYILGIAEWGIPIPVAVLQLPERLLAAAPLEFEVEPEYLAMLWEPASPSFNKFYSNYWQFLHIDRIIPHVRLLVTSKLTVGISLHPL